MNIASIAAISYLRMTLSTLEDSLKETHHQLEIEDRELMRQRANLERIHHNISGLDRALSILDSKLPSELPDSDMETAMQNSLALSSLMALRRKEKDLWDRVVRDIERSTDFISVCRHDVDILHSEIKDIEGAIALLENFRRSDDR